MPPADRREPGRRWAVVLAVLVHLIFAAVLVFGVSWQAREAGPVMAELWSSLPPAPVQKAMPEPKPAPEVKPEPKPEPEPKVEPKPEPKVEQPKPPKVDIELKAKVKEKKRKEEQKKLEEQKKAEAEKRKQAELRRQEQEKLKQEEQQHESMRQQQEAAQAQRASAQARLENDYKGRIRDKIKRYIIAPPDVPGNPQAEFDVTLMPTGEVLNVRLTRSSGNAAYDSAVERAIYKAQPLPLPPDASLFSRFRELQLKFRLNE